MISNLIQHPFETFKCDNAYLFDLGTKGFLKIYVTHIIDIFDSPLQYYTLSSFALDRLPLVTPQKVTNSEQKISRIEDVVFRSRIC